MYEEIKNDLTQGGAGSLNALAISTLNFLIGAAAVIAVGVLIFSGYMYITASGDEAKIEKATKSLTYAIVGLAIAFIAVLLVNFVLDDILSVPATTDTDTDQTEDISNGLLMLLTA